MTSKGLSEEGRVAGRKMARKIRSIDKLCFLNARRAAHFYGLTYVEGVATFIGIPIHHAWCEDRNGEVVEVTPAWLEDDREESEYIAVVRVSHDDIGEVPVFQFGAGPEMAEAYDFVLRRYRDAES